MARSITLLVGGVAALGLAACGASHGMTVAGTTPAASSSALKVAECMRAHGVPNFPDPTNSSGGAGFSIQMTAGGSTVTVDGVGFSGPAFTAAEKTCRLGAGTAAPITEAHGHGMLESARCMRAHGVPNFPDPTFGPGGKGVKTPSSTQVNRNSPAFTAAAKACAHVGTPIPGGG